MEGTLNPLGHQVSIDITELRNMRLALIPDFSYLDKTSWIRALRNMRSYIRRGEL
jgi:hypothetical protein